jgi:hypothetical protein
MLLGESYLELLAIADAGKASPALTRRLAVGEGWLGFAVQSGDIAAEVAEMRWRGAQVEGPHPGRLVAPDGAARGWRTATLGTRDLWASAAVLSFLIQHDTSGEQHCRALAGAGGDQPHSNGARSLLDVAIAVGDLDAVGRRYVEELGLLAREPRQRDATLCADVLRLALPSGDRIMLAQPIGPGIAQARLDAAGDGLCRVSVGVANLSSTAAYLRRAGIAFTEAESALHVSPEEAHGAALRFAL